MFSQTDQCSFYLATVKKYTNLKLLKIIDVNTVFQNANTNQTHFKYEKRN